MLYRMHESCVKIRSSGPIAVKMQSHGNDGALSAILDLAQVMVRDLDGRITAWSKGSERLYGWPDSEAVGQVSHHLLSTVFPKPVAEIEADLLGDGQWHGDLQHRSRDGRQILVASHWSLRRDSQGQPITIIEVNNDVTERQRADLAALRLAAIVESSDDAIISETLDGIITTWNRGAQELFGYSDEEAVGKPIAMLVPPARADELAGILARIRRGERVERFEIERIAKGGRVLQVSLSMSPIYDESGRIVGASKISHDVTPLK